MNKEYKEYRKKLLDILISENLTIGKIINITDKYNEYFTKQRFDKDFEYHNSGVKKDISIFKEECDDELNGWLDEKEIIHIIKNEKYTLEELTIKGVFNIIKHHGDDEIDMIKFFMKELNMSLKHIEEKLIYKIIKNCDDVMNVYSIITFFVDELCIKFYELDKTKLLESLAIFVVNHDILDDNGNNVFEYIINESKITKEDFKKDNNMFIRKLSYEKQLRCYDSYADNSDYFMTYFLNL